jgi:hypothetical protein
MGCPTDARLRFGADRLRFSFYGAARRPSSSAGALEIDDIGTNLADIQQAPNGAFIARILPGPNESDFFFNSSSPNGWNLLAITTSAAGITFSIDGTAVGSSPLVTSFRLLSLQNYGGPLGSAFFDDFNATTSNTPEPSTVSLFALAGLVATAFAGLRAMAKLRTERPSVRTSELSVPRTQKGETSECSSVGRIIGRVGEFSPRKSGRLVCIPPDRRVIDYR